MTEQEKDAAARHKARMERKKAVVDAHIAAADTDRGVFLVNTGNGKGKSSSGFGMVARALGHGMKVGVVQFIKGSRSTGEETFFRRFPDEVVFKVMGDGFTWETQDKERDIAKAMAAWDEAKKFLSDPAVGLVLLDELNIALKRGYLEVAMVIEGILKRPPQQHVIVTGRSAPQALIDAADTVTDMGLTKHAFAAGIKAQPGVEW